MDVVCTTPPGEDSPDSFSKWMSLKLGEVMREEDGEGVAVHRVKLPAGRSLRRNMLFNDVLARHLKVFRADVAQLLTLEPLRTPRTSCTERTGVRSVFTGTLLPSLSTSAAKRWLQRQWIRHPLQKPDHIVVSSTVMLDFYRSLGVSNPMSVIPNGVDLERFRWDGTEEGKNSARRILAIPATTHVILFVGSIIHRKGVDLLLSAFTRVASVNPQAHLILVGPREGAGSEKERAYRAGIDELVQGSGCAERIRFTGYAETVDVYLRAADVLVLPSRHEGMGNVVLEAMAAGVPTVLTPYLGLPAEFGVPGTEYVLSALDAQCLAEHVQSLLEDPERRRVVASNGRRWVEEHMSMSRVIDAYANVYRDLAVDGEVKPCNRKTSWIDQSPAH